MTPDPWTTGGELRGDPHTIRLSASLLDRTDRHCRDYAALKARPKIWPQQYEKRRYPPWEAFPLGLVMEALNEIEFEGAAVGAAVAGVIAGRRSTVHPGAASWIRHACEAYVQATAWIADELDLEDVDLVPDPLPRVVQHESAAELRLLTAWGRWYRSADGAVREFRRLRMSRAGARDAPSNDALAFVAAAGHRTEGDMYRDLPVELLPDENTPTRVRLVEVVLAADVVPRVLVDASPAEVRRV
jgi:hypothetical protein